MLCWFCGSPAQTKLLWPLKMLHLQQSFKYCGWFFMTSNSCKVCVRVTVVTGTSSTDTLDTSCCSQEVLLLFLVLGLLLRMSSSWSLSQSLWKLSNDWVRKQICHCWCGESWCQFNHSWREPTKMFFVN